MASQPANTEIAVKRRVRSYRQMLRHNNIHGMVNRLRPLVMSVPADETLDTVIRITDVDSDIVTTAIIEGRGSGLPVVRGLKSVLSLEEAIVAISHLAFPIVIGQDKFLNKQDGYETEDLHADLRAARS